MERSRAIPAQKGGGTRFEQSAKGFGAAGARAERRFKIKKKLGGKIKSEDKRPRAGHKKSAGTECFIPYTGAREKQEHFSTPFFSPSVQEGKKGI